MGKFAVAPRPQVLKAMLRRYITTLDDGQLHAALHCTAYDRQSIVGMFAESDIVQALNLQLLFQDSRARNLPLSATAQYLSTLGGGHHCCIINIKLNPMAGNQQEPSLNSRANRT